MRKVLLISSDMALVRELTWVLEEAGYFVTPSNSLGEPFFSGDQASASCVIIVDYRALGNELWQAQQLLRWFRLQCPVILLTGEGTVAIDQWDCLLPRNAAQDRLVPCIQKLRPVQ